MAGLAEALSSTCPVPPHPVGLVWHELYMWHDQGPLASNKLRVQPTPHWENPETKRRMYNLLAVSGLLDHLHPIKPRKAAPHEVARVHDREYLIQLQAASDDEGHGHRTVGEEACLAPGGYGILLLSAGGVLAALDAVMTGLVRSAYALVRPPGHHAERDRAMGFCYLNNIAIAARQAQDVYGLQRVAIVDWDVHHGNGTQHMFEEDDTVLFISVHQDSNYPVKSGAVTEVGQGRGECYTINVPLPPGSGSGAYRATFDRVVAPALDLFQPELVLVSCGFDASYLDPLSAMMLSSEDFRYMTACVMEAANKHCSGRLVLVHEGGYSELYVPFCGLATIEQLADVRTSVTDPCLDEVSQYGYQELQPHQDLVIRRAEGVVEMLRAKLDSCAAGSR